MSQKIILLLGALALTCTSSLQSADATAETKLRESLRNTMLQLRTVQNDKVALQAQQGENEQKLKALTAQVAALMKQASEAEKASADQAVELAKFKEAIEKWKVAYEQSSTVASAKEIERARLAESSIMLQRHVADLQTRNAALFKLGNEILLRYERFSLGDALAAKEPFTGITRVKLENLVQDYQDKLAAHKARQ